MTCLGLFVTRVGGTNELILERRGAGQISWAHVEKQFEKEESKPSPDQSIAGRDLRADDESAPDPRSVTTVTVLATNEQKSGDQPLEHSKPVPRVAEEAATLHQDCIKRRLFCMKEEVASMDRLFQDERLTTIKLV